MEKTITKISYPEKPKRKIKVAAYCRVSSGKDAMLHSLSAQISYFQRLIQAESEWQFVEVYADEALTGTKESRGEFQRLLADCSAGKIDMVITKSISRFARNTVTLLQAVRELKAMNVDVYFEEQNIHTMDADGELMLTILASYAQEESRSASENQKWRVRKNFEEGIPWRGKMLGYRMGEGQLIVIPEEAEIVRRIFREYLAGCGSITIAKHLIDDNIPSISGCPWSASSIAKILQNYNYTGNLILQKTFRKDHITKRTVVNNGQLPKFLAEETHEAIIDMDTFEAAQAERHRRATKYNKGPKENKTYAYTGLLVCAQCGKKYRRKTTATQPVWICSTFNEKGKKYCASKQIPEIVLDTLIPTVAPRAELLDHIEVDKENTLRFFFTDGSSQTHTWQDRSRSCSWTPEKREQARQKSRERLIKNG
ncbi:MAG: recombinase family protein [Ruminococcaceae bacterium]|nr:recombinase family protein [Oscillospiraceae bacterium]